MTTELDIVNACDELQLAIVAMLEPDMSMAKMARVDKALREVRRVEMNVRLEAQDRFADNAP